MHQKHVKNLLTVVAMQGFGNFDGRRSTILTQDNRCVYVSAFTNLIRNVFDFKHV